MHANAKWNLLLLWKCLGLVRLGFVGWMGVLAIDGGPIDCKFTKLVTISTKNQLRTLKNEQLNLFSTYTNGKAFRVDLQFFNQKFILIVMKEEKTQKNPH